MCLFLFFPRAGHSFAVLSRGLLASDDRSSSCILFLVDSIISCAEAGEHGSSIARNKKIHGTNGYILHTIKTVFNGHQTYRDAFWAERDVINKRNRLSCTRTRVNITTL